MELDSLSSAEVLQEKLEEPKAAMRQTKDKRMYERYQCIVKRRSKRTYRPTRRRGWRDWNRATHPIARAD